MDSTPRGLTRFSRWSELAGPARVTGGCSRDRPAPDPQATGLRLGRSQDRGRRRG